MRRFPELRRLAAAVAIASAVAFTASVAAEELKIAVAFAGTTVG